MVINKWAHLLIITPGLSALKNVPEALPGRCKTGNGVNAWRPSHLSGKTVIKVPGLKIV
jgi:hypothetical protein